MKSKPPFPNPHTLGPESPGSVTLPEYISKMLFVTQEIAPKLRPHFAINFDYSESSLAILDDVITGCWPKPPKLLNHMVAAFGSYLGETIRRSLGGEWAPDRHNRFCVVNIGNTESRIFPFSKIEKHFLNGIEDSLACYFGTIKTAVSTLAKISRESSNTGCISRRQTLRY